MKRSLSPVASSSKRRQSSRLAATSHSGLLAKQYAYRNMAKNPLYLDAAHNLCKKYNRFVPFAQELNATSARHLSYQSGRDFEVAVQKINAIAEDACRHALGSSWGRWGVLRTSSLMPLRAFPGGTRMEICFVRD
jgi:hypothetical protein